MSPEQIRMYALEIVLKVSEPGTSADTLTAEAKKVESFILSKSSIIQ